MNKFDYLLNIGTESEKTSDMQARVLSDTLREITGVEKSERLKKDENTMDLGTIISVLASSGATLALSRGVADWLRSRRGTKLTIERDVSADSIKATIERIDPETAKQIIELIRDM